MTDFLERVPGLSTEQKIERLASEAKLPPSHEQGLVADLALAVVLNRLEPAAVRPVTPRLLRIVRSPRRAVLHHYTWRDAALLLVRLAPDDPEVVDAIEATATATGEEAMSRLDTPDAPWTWIGEYLGVLDTATQALAGMASPEARAALQRMAARLAPWADRIPELAPILEHAREHLGGAP